MSSPRDKWKEIQERRERIKKRVEKIRHRVVIFSGKGGVGKTTVAVNLSYGVSVKGFSVGLLDADITGPNVPKMLGITEPPSSDGKNMYPILKDGIKVISIAGFIPKDAPVIWRGPLRSIAIEQFLGDVEWGELDFLFADLPPGTGDEVLTIAQEMEPDMAIVVTTPQELAIIDSTRAVNMAKKLGIKRIAIVENMSYLSCPHCGKEIDIFGKGGGKKEAEMLGVEFIGEIPLDLRAREYADKGISLFNTEDIKIKEDFLKIADKVIELLGEKK